MDALKFIKEHKRMCDMYGDDGCDQCPLSFTNNELGMACEDLKNVDLEQYVFIIEKWSKTHPVKTRQAELLKVYPNAKLSEEGVSIICPNYLVEHAVKCCSKPCNVCREQYWLQEVD